MHGNSFNWFTHIPGFGKLPLHVAGQIFISAVLIAVLSLARASLKKTRASAEGILVPSPKFSLQNIFEVTAEGLYGLVESGVGEHEARRYFPLIGTLFLFIFTSNLMGLVPGLLPPTEDFNTTLALGTFVFLYYNYLGFKEHGWGYLKHFMGPVLALAPLIFVIEIISNFIRPLSLALRLRGNIMGDHLVLTVFNDLTPYLVPVIFYGLGLFVSFIQAFVFCLMTMVYISLSTAHDH